MNPLYHPQLRVLSGRDWGAAPVHQVNEACEEVPIVNDGGMAVHAVTGGQGKATRKFFVAKKVARASKETL